MKKSVFNLSIKCAILSAVLFSSLVTAADITYNRRAITDYTVLPNNTYNNKGITNTPNYIDSWNKQTSVISSTSLISTNSIVEGQGSFEELVIRFSTAFTETLGFKFALDAGFGGALYLDGNQIAYNAHDMWWGGNWNNSSQILSDTLNVASGNHTLTAIWAEQCCAGNGAALVTINGGVGKSLTVLDNPHAVVPEPETIALFAIGLMIITHVQRKAARV